MSSSRSLAAAVTLSAAILVLAGCAPAASTTHSPAAEPKPPSSPAATNGAQSPVLEPAGAAADNQAFFDYVSQQVVAANPDAGGVEFTSALRDHGFNIAAMQVTADITTVGVKADAIQFSVRWGDDCLIGHYGQHQYGSAIAPVLGSDTCLIGQTRPITW